MVLSVGGRSMGDILSQNEIDELLKALNTGEIDVQEFQKASSEKKIRNHDFRRPSKFSKDHIKTLTLIHENYARLLTNFLTGYLRTLVQIDVMAVEALPYSDFSNSVPTPAILAIVDFMPLQGSIIFEIAPNIAFALIDRILGGRGYSISKAREFTEIELAIIEKVLNQILNLMKEPWNSFIELRPKLERIESNAQFVQLVSENETVALVTFNTKVGEVEGLLNICIPYVVVESIVPKLSTKYWFSFIGKEPHTNMSNVLGSRIENTVVPIRAILGKSEITVGDFLELEVGDVLPLNTNVDGEIEILVENIPKFYGKAGIKKKRSAVKITRLIEKEVGLDE